MLFALFLALVHGPVMSGPCPSLLIVNADEEPKPDPDVAEEDRNEETEDIVTYTVRNSGPVPVYFVMTWDMRVYPRKTIGAEGEIEVTIHVPPTPYREYLTKLRRNGGRAIRPHLQDCTTLRGYDKTPGAPIPW